MAVSESEIEGLSPTDRSLVVLVRGGDEAAATALYERYARRVLRLVESQFGDRVRAGGEPEDVVQSVFRSIFRGVQSGSYDAPPGSNLWNLIAVIAVNKVRRNATQLSAQCRDVSKNVSIDETYDGIILDQSSIDSLETSIRDTLEILHPRDQELLSLRIQGHTVDEISDITGRSRRTVERRLHESREKLANYLLDT